MTKEMTKLPLLEQAVMEIQTRSSRGPGSWLAVSQAAICLSDIVTILATDEKGGREIVERRGSPCDGGLRQVISSSPNTIL